MDNAEVSIQRQDRARAENSRAAYHHGDGQSVLRYWPCACRSFKPEKHAEKLRGVSGTIDSASFADHTGTGGRATVMNSLYDTRWQPVEKNAASRLAGKAAIHSRLAIRKDTGEPGMKFFSTCHHLIHDLPRLTYNDNNSNQEDVDSAVTYDHSYDALRYLLERRKTSSCWVRLPGL